MAKNKKPRATAKKPKAYKYELTIAFESTEPVTATDQGLAQYENGLGYFVEGDLTSSPA
jgi:hypothetical protein